MRSWNIVQLRAARRLCTAICFALVIAISTILLIPMLYPSQPWVLFGAFPLAGAGIVLVAILTRLDAYIDLWDRAMQRPSNRKSH